MEETIEASAGKQQQPELAQKGLNDGSSEDLKSSTTATDESDELHGLPLREFKVVLPFLKDPIAFNPLVSLIGVVMLWGLAIWSMADPDNSNETLVGWRGDITRYFTWLFVGSKAFFFFFLVYITFRYYNVKLGKPDEKPEFDDFNFFFMIFAAGVAVGLFVYGVSEPLWHQSSHWYANAGYHSQDEIDNFAIFLTINDWALSGWAVYLVVAIAQGIAGHRFNLPMTFRSCFYPILLDHTWGWIGDVIDGVTIVVSVAGVCTSLGLGALQIVAGFQYLGWVEEDISQDRETLIANLTIWAITCISTASVLSGLDAGIKFLSQVAFFLGMILLTFVLVADDTKFFLNLIVQQTGYYLQWGIFELNFWTDTWSQLEEGQGRAVDGNAGAEWWMNAWLVFYQAWWVSWSAFVGMFVARISRGRTVGQVVIYSMVAPVLYCILWFSVWGGAGIRHSRQADELIALGGTYFNDTDYYLHPGSTVCYDVPQQDEIVDGAVVFTNKLPGITPVCKFDTNVPDFAAFNVLNAFSFPDSFDTGYGNVLNVLFIFALAIYFATSSDSGSLVVDHLSANGRLHHHWVQRAFWAITEGAVATAILSAGGSSGLQAVQAAAIIFGLPFVFLLVFVVQSISLFCEQAAANPEQTKYEKPQQKTFTTPIYGEIFNIFEYIASCGSVHPERIAMKMDKPTSFHMVEFAKGLFVPFLPLHQVLSVAYPRNNGLRNMFTVISYSVLYYTWIGLFIGLAWKSGLKAAGWIVFFSGGCLLASIRHGFRERYNIRSNVVADFMSAWFFWPQVFVQMREHCIELGLPNDKLDDKLEGEEHSEVEETQMQNVDV